MQNEYPNIRISFSILIPLSLTLKHRRELTTAPKPHSPPRYTPALEISFPSFGLLVLLEWVWRVLFQIWSQSHINTVQFLDAWISNLLSPPRCMPTSGLCLPFFRLARATRACFEANLCWLRSPMQTFSLNGANPSGTLPIYENIYSSCKDLQSLILEGSCTAILLTGFFPYFYSSLAFTRMPYIRRQTMPTVCIYSRAHCVC